MVEKKWMKRMFHANNLACKTLGFLTEQTACRSYIA